MKFILFFVLVICIAQGQVSGRTLTTNASDNEEELVRTDRDLTVASKYAELIRSVRSSSKSMGSLVSKRRIVRRKRALSNDHDLTSSMFRENSMSIAPIGSPTDLATRRRFVRMPGLIKSVGNTIGNTIKSTMGSSIGKSITKTIGSTIGDSIGSVVSDLAGEAIKEGGAAIIVNVYKALKKDTMIGPFVAYTVLFLGAGIFNGFVDGFISGGVAIALQKLLPLIYKHLPLPRIRIKEVVDGYKDFIGGVESVIELPKLLGIIKNTVLELADMK